MTGISVIAAALAGALIALGGAPLELFAATLLAPGAMLIALEPRPGHVVTPRRAIALGLVTGMVVNLSVEWWIVGLLQDFGGFSLPLAMLIGALMWFGESLPYMAGMLLAAQWLRDGAPRWIAVPLCLTLAASLSPGLFPWRYGVSAIGFLPYAQVGELGGLPLLDALQAFVSCALVDGLRRRRNLPLFVAAACLALPAIYGAVRMDQVEAERAAAPSIAIGVVQPNVGIFDKHDRAQWMSQLRDQRRTTRALEAAGAELVLWPETAYRFPVTRDVRHDREGPLGLLQDGVHGPLLVGVVSTSGTRVSAIARDERGQRVGIYQLAVDERYNSAMAVARDGQVVGIADKVELLAFGEYTPFWEYLPFNESIPRGMSRGVGAQVLEVAGARIGTLNCYEDLLFEHVRAQARAQPELWANLTNNTWFGDTTAPFLHHMNARMRAIETRRDLVRAVNSGVSGHTAATGVDLRRTGSFVRASFVSDVRRLTGTTLYVWLGDWVAPLAFAWLVAFAAVRRRVRSWS